MQNLGIYPGKEIEYESNMQATYGYAHTDTSIYICMLYVHIEMFINVLKYMN
jgi:hypothetical protein